MTDVSPGMPPRMPPVMSAPPGKDGRPLWGCGGRDKDGEGQGQQDSYEEDSHTPDVTHGIPSC
jgi:hypothetical protein